MIKFDDGEQGLAVKFKTPADHQDISGKSVEDFFQGWPTGTELKIVGFASNVRGLQIKPSGYIDKEAILAKMKLIGHDAELLNQDEYNKMFGRVGYI